MRGFRKHHAERKNKKKLKFLLNYLYEGEDLELLCGDDKYFQTARWFKPDKSDKNYKKKYKNQRRKQRREEDKAAIAQFG